MTVLVEKSTSMMSNAWMAYDAAGRAVNCGVASGDPVSLALRPGQVVRIICGRDVYAAVAAKLAPEKVGR